MATFKTVKQLFVTPNVANIEPDTVYYVRAGEGFDLYCTDSTGNAVYQINKREDNSLAYPSGLVVDNSITAFSSSTFIPVNNNIKFFPFILKSNLKADFIRFNVTTAGVGTIALYLMESNTLAVPENLIFKVPSSNFSLSNTGIKGTANVQRKISNSVFTTDNISNFTFKAGKFYWWGVFTTGTAPRIVGINQNNCLALGNSGGTGAFIFTAYNVNVTSEPNDITDINNLGIPNLVNYVAPSIQFNTITF